MNVLSARPSSFRRYVGAVALLCTWRLADVRAIAEEPAAPYRVGVAKVDVTPGYPVRLNGFGGRRDESVGVTQRIWAKALAIESAGDAAPIVIVTLDNLGVREPMVEEVARRVKEKAGLERDRLIVTFTHTHTAPKVAGACDTIFSEPIPPEHQARIDLYTAELTDCLEEVVLKALDDRQPATLHRAVGKVGFAKNRRTVNGPVDHDLPVLVVRSPQGEIRAIYVTYACHCVTLSHNKISGDWAGYAQEAIERNHPGVIGLVAVGCGSDANPDSGVTGENLAAAADQGDQIAGEVERLLQAELTPVEGAPTATLNHIDLPLEAPPTREELEQLAAGPDPTLANNANYQLAILDRGESLLTELNYPIQTLTFGDSLAMVFLAGEVCVDYSLRLKNELDADRLWMHGYSNDFCSYIPSERLLKEGGYGGGAEVTYFGLPNKLAPGLEDKIIAEVHRQLPKSFKRPGRVRESASIPLPLEEAVASIQARDGYVVELVAAEPLISDPVAVDFAPDGRLWVADMTDYEREVDEEFEQTGSVRLLTDRDGDGRYDEAAKFVSGLRFPTGVKAWRQGVIVCDAPDMIYFEDSDGDGRADVRQVLITGFDTRNPQARVNSLRWGLDNWLYGACGIFGGDLTTFSDAKLSLGGRDFRFRPDTGEIEAVTGQTQQGRDCNDWGDWFGCNNGTLAMHFPVVDRYLARNPHVLPPDVAVFVPTSADGADPHALHPISDPVLFALSGPPGRPTGACGLGVYRDELLGSDFRGNTFTAEPANNLVHRRVLSPNGVSFVGYRAEGEADAEFVAATDTWFRPVQIRTGPDGCLWIVDMHRAMIEHKMFVPAEQLAEVDVWGGREQGRIYRVRPRNVSARQIMPLDRLDSTGLADALDSPNGPQRDMAHQLLIERGAKDAAPRLKELASKAERPVTRLHAICVLEGLGELDAATALAGLRDAHPGVRRHAIRVSESLADGAPEIVESLLALAADENPQVRMQLAYSVGELKDPRAAAVLARLALAYPEEGYLQSAVWSSVNSNNVADVVQLMLRDAKVDDLPSSLLTTIVTMATKLGDVECCKNLAASLSRADDDRPSDARLQAAAELLEQVQQADDSPLAEITELFSSLIAASQEIVDNGEATERSRLAALRLLAASGSGGDLIPQLAELLSAQNSPAVQQAVIRVISLVKNPAAGEAILSAWNGFTPPTRALAFDLILGREDLVEKFLAAAEQGGIRASDLDALQRERLLLSKNERIRQRAAAALAGAIDANREELVQQYLAADDSQASLERGRDIFAKVCSSCHRLEGQGHEVGPDLAALTNRTRQTLTESIIDPNRSVDQRYRTYTALTLDGLAHAGLLKEETSTSVTLLEQQGQAHTLLRSELELLENSGRSLMPEGLEKDVSPAELVDLIAYLTTQLPPAKQIAGNVPETIYPDYDGSLWLVAASCQVYGDQITFEAPFKNIGYWHGQHDHVSWNLHVPAGGDYDVYVELACTPDSALNRAVLEGVAPSISFVVPSTGGYDRYQIFHVGGASLPAGDSRLVLRPDGPLAQPNLMDLRGVYLIPASPTGAPRRPPQPPGDGEDAATRIAKLLDGLAARTAAQYEQIPAIWEEAIAAGRRNESRELRRLLDLSLPAEGEPLAHWQAVVVGGGVVNGVSQAGVWPRQRLEELMANDGELKARWERTVKLARDMADDASVPGGTRYDALRILGADQFEGSGEKLLSYLAPGVNAELQMGAVSGLGDVDSPEATAALIDACTHLQGGNLELAVEALLRNEERALLLAEAIENNRISADAVTPAQRQRLKFHDPD